MPQVCGIFGDSTRVCAFTPMGATPRRGLCNSSANLCMTNNLNLLMDVRPCTPFKISLATTNGEHSHTNICQHRGLLPLPLIDSTTYYQTCFVNPYASETFISPQAIINSSDGSFNKWQMEGFLQGRPGILSLYSPSGLLKISIQLLQQDRLYYSLTNTFTVDINPRSRSSPFIGLAFTELPPDLHLIDNDDCSECSDHPDDNVSTTDSANINNNWIHATSTPADAHNTPPCFPDDPMPTRPPAQQQPMTRSQVSVRPTNFARQLESKLWATHLGHCSKNQLISLTTRAIGLPNYFKFHLFCHID